MKIQLFIAMAALIASCKSNKDSSFNSKQASDSLVYEMRVKELNEMQTHRLVVSFISIGEGISLPLKEKVESFIVESEKKYGVKIARISKNWGREGETDILFSLKELKPDQQKEFISELKSLANGNQLIQIEENKPVRAYRN